jgi:hypothetical protein
MKINDEILNKVRELSDEIEKKSQLASELMRVAKDRFGETSISIERKIKGSDIKFVQAKQNDLWQEVFQLGKESQAGKTLREKHPQVFEAYDEVDKITREFNTLATMELGIQGYQRISLKDIVNLAEGIAEWKIKKLIKKDALDSIEIEVGKEEKEEIELVKHIVNEKDLEINPELKENGVKVGDEIGLPIKKDNK